MLRILRKRKVWNCVYAGSGAARSSAACCVVFVAVYANANVC